jgi:ParB family chromosome partitioning protein
MKTKINANDRLASLPINDIEANPNQPRKDFSDEEALEGLAYSIDSTGYVHPIVVRKLPHNDKYQIVAGERRWRACKKLGVSEMPVIIRDIPEYEVDVHALAENWHRSDLQPWEREDAVYNLWIKSKSNNPNYEHSTEAVAQALGISHSTVIQHLKARNDRVKYSSVGIQTDELPTTVFMETKTVKNDKLLARFEVRKCR